MADTPYDRETATALASLWEQFRDAELARVEELELAMTDLLAGNLTEDRRRAAAAEAHKIAGSVGTFGFTLGSELAREMEKLLLGSAPLGQAQTLRLSQLVVDLRTELEAAPAQPESATEAQLSAPQPITPGGRSCLLLIGHDPGTCRPIVAEATARGMRVEVADSLERARQVVNQEQPDVVLLDMQMPGMNGLEVLQCVAEDGELSRIPVLFMTADEEQETAGKARALGAREVAVKPLPAPALRALVTRLLEQA